MKPIKIKTAFSDDPIHWIAGKVMLAVLVTVVFVVLYALLS